MQTVKIVINLNDLNLNKVNIEILLSLWLTWFN